MREKRRGMRRMRRKKRGGMRWRRNGIRREIREAGEREKGRADKSVYGQYRYEYVFGGVGQRLDHNRSRQKGVVENFNFQAIH